MIDRTQLTSAFMRYVLEMKRLHDPNKLIDREDYPLVAAGDTFERNLKASRV